ncbi:hypothetical protein L249_4479, partial [Ophiocordyceps polyrhachis-furcata BCC 54312]
MPNTEKITFAKLSGGDNYTHWALRMDSLLIREKLQGALGSETHNKSEEAGHSARIDSLQRSSQRSARCTYSGHSTRLISAQGSRHIDRRAVLIAVIALDQSDRRAVPIAVIAPDLDGRTKLQLHHFFNTITSPAFNSSSILTKPPSRSRDVGPAVAGLRPLYVIEA